MSDELKQEVRFYASFDHRNDEEDQRGARGMIITLVLNGPLGAISADIGTGWMLHPYLGNRPVLESPKPLSPRGEKPGIDHNLTDLSPSGLSVSAHSLEQRRDWWRGSAQECPFVGGICYGDTGYLVADELVEALVGGGDEAAWKWMQECYDEWLGPES